MAAPAPPRLVDPLTRLAGVGPGVAALLAKLGLHSIRDLCFHLPSRYQDRTCITPLGGARPQREIVVEGRIETNQIQFGRRRSLVCRIGDDSGEIALRFFYFNRAQQRRLAVGRLVRCFGEIRRGAQWLEMIHPELQLIDEASPLATDGTLTPVYPTTEGLQQGRLRKLAGLALDVLAREALGSDEIDDFIASQSGITHALPRLADALAYVHRPPPEASVETLWAGGHPAQQRLALEELLTHQLSLRQARLRARAFDAPRLRMAREPRQRLLDALGFTLTGAQRRVVAEIDQDLAEARPMLRLLQGDVGAGKTAVAALVATNALAQALQVALMAPTELLAEQHARTLGRWFDALGHEVVLVTGKQAAKLRRDVRAQMEAPGPRLFVGTHALFQDDVRFADLGLVIVDEQHRFGVGQRLALLEKGAHGNRRPHQLIMTATPIPRTLAMTAYADLDVSVLDELPPSRIPVRTSVLPDSRREDILARVAERCRAGRQAYWVCPLIEESEHLDAQAATDTAEALAAALAPLHVGLIHGRMNEKDKLKVMQAFVAGTIDLLVATTVIEVGVDVPNASLMVIENADRLGLSQLHQLRGRVGRGQARSDCVLLYQGRLSENARHRLQVIRETTDGFLIAERDLELRGQGEVLGTRQTGAAEFRIADLQRDRALLPLVRAMADQLLATAPALVERLIARWTIQRIDYAKV